MYPGILSSEQKDLLPLIKLFRREFYLVGGTAIALQIGHRKSIDFDLFKATPFVAKKILDKISAEKFKYTVTRRVSEQLNLTCMNVKFTFFEYPYQIEKPVDFEGVIRMPDLLSLAAMKAFALGKRSKWKDYIDLYFLVRDFFSLETIINKAENIFKQEFSAKLFRSQLAYFADIDYGDVVEFLPGFETGEEEVKKFLTEQSLNWKN